MGPSPLEFTRNAGNASSTGIPNFDACEFAIDIICDACLADRASIHSRHGRRGLCGDDDRATTEQHVVSQQSAVTSSTLPSEVVREDSAPRTASHKLSYQSSGFCSAQPAFG